MPHQNVSSYVGEWRGNQLAYWLGSANVMKTCDYITVLSVDFVLCECSVQCHSGISSRGFTCSCSKVGRGQVNMHCILMYCWASYLSFTLNSCMVYGCCICFLEVGGWVNNDLQWMVLPMSVFHTVGFTTRRACHLSHETCSDYRHWSCFRDLGAQFTGIVLRFVLRHVIRSLCCLKICHKIIIRSLVNWAPWVTRKEGWLEHWKL